MQNVILKTSELTKQYNSTMANDNISIAIPREEIIGFVGENGSGKTTLLRTLTGLVRPTKGAFEYSDKNIKIGAIVETPAYFGGMTARENIVFHAKMCGCNIQEALDILKTVGLSADDKKKVKNYSLGMRQRLGIGLALLGKPDFLILDEPTNGLDPQGIIALRAFLEKLTKEQHITLLVSSHLLSELSQIATYYIFISHGKIVESIYASELQKKLGQAMTVKSPALTADMCETLYKDGAIGGYASNDGVWRLTGPFDYDKLVRAFGTIHIEEFETHYDSLETYYMRLTGVAKS